MFAGLGRFTKDLEAVWISFVERRLGFDLHAMRKMFNTRMAVGAVPIRAAMRLSDEMLTPIVYTDAECRGARCRSDSAARSRHGVSHSVR